MNSDIWNRIRATLRGQEGPAYVSDSVWPRIEIVKQGDTLVGRIPHYLQKEAGARGIRITHADFEKGRYEVWAL